MQPTSGADLLPAGMFEQSGLEDFNLSEGMIPRLKVSHDRGAWTINIMEGQYFPVIRVIMLGMVRQRILWQVGDLDDDAKPLCRSVGSMDPNGELFGNPNDDPKYQFPWAESGFDWQQFPLDNLNNRNLPCKNCRFKEWNTNPMPGSKAPWCAEQYTVPLMLDMNLQEEGGPEVPFDMDEAQWMPALVTFQKTALQSVRAYFTPFAAQQKPLFTAATEISLRENKKGQRSYSTPVLKKLANTTQDQWPLYSQQYVGMRGFLTKPFDRRSDDQKAAALQEQAGSTPTPPANVSAGPPPSADVRGPASPAAQQAAQPIPATPPAPPAPAPAAPAPTPPAPPTPAPAPAPTPPTPPAPPVAAAPPAPPTPPAPPAPPAAPTNTPAVSPSDLPF